jgi:hypothetical protein
MTNGFYLILWTMLNNIVFKFSRKTKLNLYEVFVNTRLSFFYNTLCPTGKELFIN